MIAMQPSSGYPADFHVDGLGGTALLPLGDRNRTGPWSLVILCVVQQGAKLNVFFGVENPAGNFLPPHLAYLRQFFGPLRNSALLRVSIAGLTLLTALAVWRTARAASPGKRQAGILYATILALAVLLIIVLGIPLETTPWDSFLRVRGH